MRPEFKRLMQIGIIVRNVDEAVKNYEEFGMGPWDRTTLRNDVPPFEDIKFNGKEIPEKGIIMKTATLACFGTEIELIEPVADTVYKEWLIKHGPGVHHIAFDTKTENSELLNKCKEKTGRDPWIKGTGIGGLMDFSYIDLREELGLIVECYAKMVPGKQALPYETKGEIVE